MDHGKLRGWRVRRWGQASHHTQAPHVSLYPDHSGVSTFLAVFSLPGICRVVHFQLLRMRARTNASMAVAMQEVPAPPHSQVQGICWGVLARTFAGPKTLVSLDLGSDSLELVNCMVDPRKTYGEMHQACGCMGKPRYRMGGGLCVGRQRNRMGNESRMKNRNMEAGGGGSA